MTTVDVPDASAAEPLSAPRRRPVDVGGLRRLLIVRSCPLPQFEDALREVRRLVPDAGVWALVQRGIEPRVAPLVQGTFVHPERSFGIVSTPVSLRCRLQRQRFDAICVPGTHADLTAYFNVLRLAARLDSSALVFLVSGDDPRWWRGAEVPRLLRSLRARRMRQTIACLEMVGGAVARACRRPADGVRSPVSVARPDRVRALVLYKNGYGWRAVATDTLAHASTGVGDESARGLGPPSRRLPDRYERLSYVSDWRVAFQGAPELDADACNVNDLIGFRRSLRRIGEYELVIVLHSAIGDDLSLLRLTSRWFERRRGKLVVFVGNEYDLMREKIAWLRRTRADVICSQLPLDAASWLYQGCGDATVLEMPHALNPSLYRPRPEVSRTVDVGFAGTLYPGFIGDTERTDLVRYMQAHGVELGFRCDIRLTPLRRTEWATFLSRCHAAVGAESGSYYMDRDFRTLAAAKAYETTHPESDISELRRRFFRKRSDVVSAKAISSRHFEPVGTKTCQILVRGRYNDILAPDEHYIAVDRDLANIAEALERLRDGGYRRALTERTFEYVMDAHTYRHRIRTLWARLGLVARG